MNRLPWEIVRPVMNKWRVQSLKCEEESKKNILYALCFILITFVLISGNYVDAQVKLKTKIPDLCFDCHKELKKGLSDRYVHFLFKQGKCITCHNSHVGKLKGLMNEEIDTICLRCHEDISNLIKKATLHSALRENNCPECHYPHSGENKYLLVKKEKTLCLNCHENLEKEFKKPFACLPFKEGKCSSCHDSHASLEDDLLLASPNKLCKECHSPRCKVGEVSIASAVKDINCTTCHTGHSSQERGLLGPYGHKVFLDKNCEECHNPIAAKREITTKIEGKDLCFSCHKRHESKYKYVDNDVHVKDAKNPCSICHDYHASGKKNLTMKETRLCINCHENTEKRTAAMEKVLRTINCAPIKDRKCFECHIPAHFDRPLNYRADEIPLCARCHASQHKITHPLGSDIIDPRNGQQVTCNSCHSMHSSNADFMLTHDRKRALCIQCHKM
jgi:predicted CXXCH cytochrome family protein